MNIIYDKELDKQVKDLFYNHPLTAGKILKSKKMKALYDYVMKCTFFIDNVALSTRMFYVIHHVQTPVVCITCNKPLKFADIKNRNVAEFRDAFNRFCCPHCECIHETTIAKLKETNKKKYGCEWTFQSQNNMTKSRKTMLKKYGCEYAQQNKKIKNKSYSTMVEKYGVKVTTQSEELLKKVVESRRSTEYKKFVDNDYVKPLFSKDEYIKNGNDISYRWKCMKCGNEFTSFKNEIWFKEGAVRSYVRCESCYPYNANGSSQSEKELFAFIYSIDCTAYNSIPANRKIIAPYELDIIVPDKNLAFEYDGLYWHSDICGTAKDYHLHKTEECEKKGIQLIHVFENEWLYKQDIVKSRIKNLFGIYGKVVFARKCEVREVDSKESKKFQEENHIQGAVNSKVSLGLYCENELISLMTFGKCRFDKKHEWELLRFCNKLGYHIPGAASRLLKHFERDYNPKSLVSYADRRWSQGKVYSALGFKLDHASKPDYWYVKGNKLESRLKFQKHKLSKALAKYDSNMSETENMRANGYSKIYDCGNLVFEKTYV